ncbi:ester cyclase [Aequorivita sp. F47161]|uniref:Ester cyclase n=1 Tax=Aequorivita vitellina TaxID=2874475 RepID=A0A9X1QV41_9FLAO|nr:ester cyclase [Aequorivita vitellina]MCG2419305.1 ester cyclase [Aequorivita vitellina]
MKIIIPLLALLLVSFAFNAQNPDPHASEESAITGMVFSDIKNDKNLDKMVAQKQITTAKKIYSKDEADVKATIEKFLIVAGNYDLTAMKKMMADKASLAIVRLRDGKWTTETTLVADHLATVNKNTSRPYFEPVKEYTIHVSDGQLAFVKADAVLHAFGVPLLNNIDYFTLIKENEVWKFINISFTSTRIPESERIYDPTIFAKSYAQAWSSKNPDFVALFYAEDGSLNINNGTPAVGRTSIAQSAKAFMDAFPDDMVVAFNKLVNTAKGAEFHWTLTGTNTGPNGTGKKVNISGFELWQLDEKGLIKQSIGSFDAEEYSRQIKYGVND